MKAYVQNLLNFTPEQKDSFLASEGWYTDDPGNAKMNTIKTASAKETALPSNNAAYNAGFLKRTELFYTNMGKTGQASRETTLFIEPVVDIFQSGRFLIPGVSIDIQIDYNDNALVVMAATGSTYKFKITKAVLLVRHVKCSYATKLEVQKNLGEKKLTAIYPIRTTKPIRHTLESNQQSFTFNDIFQQAVPDIVTMGMVKSTQFNGAYDKTPFQFVLDSLKSVRWLLNGMERPIARLEILSPDKLEAYHTLFESSGNLHRGFTPGIKREDYNNGFALMRFNFTPDGKDAKNYTYKRNRDTLELHLEFTSNLTSNLTLLLLPEFENELYIDPNKVVSMKNNY